MEHYNLIAPEKLGEGSSIKLDVSIAEVDIYWKVAIEVLTVIQGNNAKGEPTVMVVPYGPLGPYSRLVYLVNKYRVSLKNCVFMNMDEYLDENGKPVLDKNGEEKIVETKLLPGYVLVKMTMTDESWHVVRNITGVTGFVGPGSEPTPLTDAEVEMFQVEIITEEFKFNVGDKVKVVSGIFEGYSGIIQEIEEDKKSMTILASTERRDIPIMVETKDVALAE